MITKLYLKNFRSIFNSEIELGKINILTGPNNSGKSSIIYGLLALKNVVLNSNQSLDSFLNFGFLNLGGFSQTVYLKDENLNINLGIDVLKDGVISKYLASLGKKKSELGIITSKPFKISLNLEVTFPYPANQSTGCEVKGDFGIAKITWNGVTPTINIENSESADEENRQSIINDISNSLSAPIEELRNIDFIPLGRGFKEANYQSVALQQQLQTDAELATLLAADRDLEGKVAFYLEKIVDRYFNVRPTLGTANFNLQLRDKSTGLICDLVNEGYGTNQLVTILTKSLRKDTHTICIEEAEIHLHPELMDKLVNVFVEIAKEENKNFIISTHSEHIVSSLLNKVAASKMNPNDIQIYYISKNKKRTKIEKQAINEKGQIKGGLKGFYNTELKEIKEFFRVPEEK